MGVTTPTTDQTVATDSPTASNGVNLGARAQVTTKVTNVSTWTELETAIKAIASKDGTVMITPALGLITVRDRPDRLGEGDVFLTRFEAAAARQIAAEGRAFAVTRSGADSHAIGVAR